MGFHVDIKVPEKHETKWFDDGKAEGKAELIKTMLKNGANCNNIAKLTGLSTQQIEELASSQAAHYVNCDADGP